MLVTAPSLLSAGRIGSVNITSTDLIACRGPEEHSGSAAFVFGVELGKLVLGPGQADLGYFDLAEPAFTFGLGDAGA